VAATRRATSLRTEFRAAIREMSRADIVKQLRLRRIEKARLSRARSPFLVQQFFATKERFGWLANVDIKVVREVSKVSSQISAAEGNTLRKGKPFGLTPEQRAGTIEAIIKMKQTISELEPMELATTSPHTLKLTFMALTKKYHQIAGMNTRLGKEAYKAYAQLMTNESLATVEQIADQLVRLTIEMRNSLENEHAL